MLKKINQAIMDEGAKVPHDGEDEKKKSLRNQFNYQERTSQTFNLPIRERGIKTNPPVISVFSVETTQWMIFDSYMQAYEDGQRQELEEQAKLRSRGDKKPQQVV